MRTYLKNLPSVLSLCLLLAISAGCSKSDNDTTQAGDYPIQQWIEQILETNYLWNEDVKAKTPNYTLSYDNFFYSMLSTGRNDGKHDSDYDYYYSYISREAAATRANDMIEPSLGFECALTLSYQSESNVMFSIYATVTMVYEDSPAYRAGLRRGDHIYAVDGQEFNVQNYSTLYYQLWPESLSGITPVTRRLSWCSLQDSGQIKGHIPVASRYGERTESIVPEDVEANPVYYWKTFERDGKKTAYLMYNQFEYGDEQRLYNNQLKEVFREFKTLGATDLVLDLRYNRGGYVTCCQLLASMIAPADKLGTVFQKMEYNAERNRTEEVKFLTEQQMSGTGFGSVSGIGTNLNLSRLFVLVTGTTASSSESLIHCLRAAGVDTYLIGTPTEGKNVGMNPYNKTIDNYSYEMWPITFYVKDANGQGFSSDGFTPDAEYDETLDVAWLPFGDENEPMLKLALDRIYGTRSVQPSPAVRSSSAISDPGMRKIRSAGATFLHRNSGMKDERSANE